MPKLHNLAVGGAKLEAELATSIPDTEADLISVAYGTNDCNVGRTLASYRENTKRLLEALQERWPGRPIVLITPLTWTRPPEPNSEGLVMDDYRVAARETAAAFEDVHVAAGDELVDADDSLFVDKVHPNEAGFAQYAERLLPTLQAALGDRTAGRA